MIGYCSNVHPGVDWNQFISNLQYAIKVREQVLSHEQMPLGLWISAEAAESALKKQSVFELNGFCKDHRFHIHSLNAFPYGHFHQDVVKQTVYQPTWQTSDRIEYLKNLLKILAQSNSTADEVSISTLPLGYHTDLLDPNFLSDCANQLIEAAQVLKNFEHETGIKAHLSIEPEPFCALEKSIDVVHFFKNYLLNQTQSQDLILDKIRVCYDTCHAAIQFEAPNDIIESYQQLGVQVGKVQISSALKINFSNHSKNDLINALTPFANDQRYLHQVVGFENKARISFEDLPQAMQFWNDTNPKGEYRIHYHLPIHMEQFNCLSTTQEHILDLFKIHQRQPLTQIWEVETYTWDVLPKEYKNKPLPSLIAQEINWALQKMRKHEFDQN